MKLTLQNVLKNKYVLYAVSALAVLNVLGYLSIGSMECLGVFALTALVCQQYNKNMTVCLLAALFAANVVFGCGRIKENFVEAMESNDAPTPDTVDTASDAAGQAAGDAVMKKTGDAEAATAAANDAASQCKVALVNGACPEGESREQAN